jgi:hypothetical protein
MAPRTDIDKLLMDIMTGELDDQADAIWRALRARHQMRRDERTLRARATLVIGGKARLSDQMRGGIAGELVTVEDIKRTRAHVRLENGVGYRVPLSALTSVTDEPTHDELVARGQKRTRELAKARKAAGIGTTDEPTPRKRTRKRSRS